MNSWSVKKIIVTEFYVPVVGVNITSDNCSRSYVFKMKDNSIGNDD